MKALFNRVTYRIHPIPPFRLDLTAWALRRRPDNAIDQWDGRTYRRAIMVEDKVVLIEVEQSGNDNRPGLSVTASGDLPDTGLKNTRALVSRILGAHIDLSQFYRFAEQDPDLGPLILQFRGVKPPRFPTLFEALLNSISCQQISLNVCVRLLNRLVARWGPAFSLSNAEIHAFPLPQHLLNARPEDFRSMGYSYNKARAILEIVQLIDTNQLDLNAVTHMDDAAAISTLMQLRGVGHWTAEYTLLRGDGRTHIFPTGDAGAIANLQRWLSQDRNLTPERLSDVLVSWAPYVGLVYFHLLLRRLTELGYLHE